MDGCSGVVRCTGLGVEEEERGARNDGAGAVAGCSGLGRCTGVGVEEDERGARNDWRGVEIFQPVARFYTRPHHCRF